MKIKAGDYLRHKLTGRKMLALTNQAGDDDTFFVRDQGAVSIGGGLEEPRKVYAVEVEPWKDADLQRVGRS